jgi:hypothetical protein
MKYPGSINGLYSTSERPARRVRPTPAVFETILKKRALVKLTKARSGLQFSSGLTAP